ncbi:hypothetical protein BpHYR1_035515 [Brachionus plicatilis]|uniref:Uncharacterized protein n=1 Tax=Brachionus plicatilis TaxID=10195 RepID=A0A3M7SD19_BRAPC|nr:hypothetical protein BpHYR1_035515 [Brachionus plicatilis]
MMYPDTDSSNTSNTSSEDTEPSSEETYEVASRQTRPISPSECNKAAFVQQTVNNSMGKNRDYQLMVEGLQLTEATQYITQLDSLISSFLSFNVISMFASNNECQILITVGMKKVIEGALARGILGRVPKRGPGGALV